MYHYLMALPKPQPEKWTKREDYAKMFWNERLVNISRFVDRAYYLKTGKYNRA